MKRFYINALLEPGQLIHAPDDIVRHMHVIRIKKGEDIAIFDGKNTSYHCKVSQLEKRNISIEVINRLDQQIDNSIQTTLAVGLIANDKMDFVIQKSVELGINNIIPLITERSQRLDGSRIDNRLTHWKNIIINSCCQCGQNLLPNINAPIDLENFLGNNYDLKLVMLPTTNTQKDTLSGSQKINNVVLLVGPEGGFTQLEENQILKNQFKPLQLGHLIMRTETASIAGLSTINSSLNIWKTETINHEK